MEIKLDRYHINRKIYKIKLKLHKLYLYIFWPFIWLRNYILVKNFPFLEPQCGWGIDMCYLPKGYKYNYEQTWLDCLSSSWRKKFGLAICKELKQAIKQYGLKDYKVCQVKEKFGTLEWYDEGGCDATINVINKYNKISMETCFNCGRPAEYVSTNWITYYCPRCAKRKEKKGIKCVPIKK